jgi:hypothetical protein
MKVAVCFMLAVGLVSANIVAIDEQPDDVRPAMFGMLSSKLAAAENFYNEVGDKEESSNPETAPSPCCFPNVWQGKVETDYAFTGIKRNNFDMNVNGQRPDRRQSLAVRTVEQLYVDGNNQRLAADVLECRNAGQIRNYSYIFKVQANKSVDLYLFDKASKQCRHRQLPGCAWKRACVPSGAQLRAKMSLGPLSGGLPVQAWSYQSNPKRMETVVAQDEENDVSTSPARSRVSVTGGLLVVPGKCIPVMAQEEGKVFMRSANGDRSRYQGFSFIGSGFYGDIKGSIADPSVFNVPSYCSKGNTDDMDDFEDEFPSVVERFLTL